MATYEDILNAAMDEVTEPEDLPDGTYRSSIVSAKFNKAKDEDTNDFVMFVYTPAEAQDDVDEVGLEGIDDLTEERIFHRFWLGDRRDFYKLNLHLDAFGVDYAGLTRGQALEAAVGAEALVSIEASGDFVNVTGVAPL